MRHLITSLTLLCAACVWGPTTFADDEVIGHYEMVETPEICFTLDLAPHGRCTWTFFQAVGVGHKATVTGRWNIELDRIAIETDPIDYNSITAYVAGPYLGAVTLNLRRWDGHVYLVPRSDLRYFDDYGPTVEFCFAKDGAPLSMGPHAPLKSTES